MPDFNQLGTQQLQQIKDDLLDRYREFKSRGIALDITRGKPCPEQLDLSSDMLDINTWKWRPRKSSSAGIQAST